VTFVIAPYRGVASFSAAELLRVITGAGIYVLAAYGLRSPKEVAHVMVGLIGIAALIALADFWQLGQTTGIGHGPHERNLFGTHENYGALLLMALPIPLALGLTAEIEDKRRIAAQIATLVLATALFVDRSRSAWIGATIAVLLVLFFTALLRPWKTDEQHAAPSIRKRRTGAAIVAYLTSPAALIAFGLVAVIGFSGMATTLKHRANVQTALTDRDVIARLSLWRAASRMVSDRPWTGWGLGSYLVLQGRWTHVGDDVAEVLTNGTDQSNSAHDYYVQWGADTGAPGLFLYCAGVTAFLVAGVGAICRWRREPSPDSTHRPVSVPPFQQALLIGSVAAVAGASADAVGSPAYAFHGITAVFWLLAGLGVAAMRPVVTPARTADTAPAGALPAVPALQGTPLGAWVISSSVGLAIVGLVLTIGQRQRALGFVTPRGVLSVTAIPSGVVHPGQRLTWRAIFRDEQGKEENTSPGTLWEFNADRQAVKTTRGALIRFDDGWPNRLHSYSGFSIVLPDTAQPITAHAIYYDAYGRRYDAWSVIRVTPFSRRQQLSHTPKQH